MAEPLRKNDTPDDRAREQVARLTALRRLHENPDFAVLVAFLNEQYAARWHQLPRQIATAEQQARYNFLMGEMSGLQLAMGAADTLEKADREKVKTQSP